MPTTAIAVSATLDKLDKPTRQAVIDLLAALSAKLPGQDPLAASASSSLAFWDNPEDEVWDNV